VLRNRQLTIPPNVGTKRRVAYPMAGLKSVKWIVLGASKPTQGWGEQAWPTQVNIPKPSRRRKGEKEDVTPCTKMVSWQVKRGQRCVYGDVAQPVDRIGLNLHILLLTRNMEARCSLSTPWRGQKP
jgi:hypothetical protein